MYSSRYVGSWVLMTPFLRLNEALQAAQRDSMLFVCTPVAGSTEVLPVIYSLVHVAVLVERVVCPPLI